MAKAFQLECDEIVTIDTPDQEFLISIPNKQQNKQAVEFLQSEQRLNLGNIYFTTLCADENSTFCGTPAYDFNDNHAGSQVLVEITNLPLHLWTFETVDFMLHPYCVISELYPDTITYNDLLAFRCICWTDAPENVPLRMNIKIRRRFRDRANTAIGIHLDMFTVLISVLNNPFSKIMRPIEPLPPVPNARDITVDAAAPHCFLQDTEVDLDRFQELSHSIILKREDGVEPIDTKEIFSAVIRYIPASRYVMVKPISFDAFLVYYQGGVQYATFAAFRSTVLARGHIELGGHIFKAIPWCSSYGGQQISLIRFIRVSISELPAGILRHEIASQLLSTFVLVEENGLPGQGFINTHRYDCFGWVDSVIDIPDYITIYITPRGCESDYMHTGHHYMPLYTRQA